MISLITALDPNFLIGNCNMLPWHYPQDLKFFKKMTNNKNVLMGYCTYKSLKKYYKNKNFLFQKTYVASFDQSLQLPDAIVINNLFNFLKNIQDEIIIIGGSQIYKQTLPYINILYVTHILTRFQGDSFFPFVNLKKYKIVSKKIYPELIFVEYHKIS
ncbi:Dihydrofolate reductase [Candidatus Phytoplasma mali]|uniref:dihydrofolate reductase n=1 Tax=Phytoplasma mali (strain AT) TaxID=482235 RepID=B3QZX1_PHYMT|nr:dihydrofolate reductase [Candidatus Phytoplasma mali]CAP18508.1 Dihydrofolate reductase [Candidatus Phytoplasma mali]